MKYLSSKMIHRYTQIKDKRVSGYYNCIKIRRISKRQQNNKYFYSSVTTLLGSESSFLFQFIKLGKSLLIIDDLSRGNNKQSGQVQIHDRAKKLVESMMNEFRLIFSSITAGKLKLGRVVAKQLVQNRTEVFCALLLRY